MLFLVPRRKGCAFEASTLIPPIQVGFRKLRLQKHEDFFRWLYTERAPRTYEEAELLTESEIDPCTTGLCRMAEEI